MRQPGQQGGPFFVLSRLRQEEVLLRQSDPLRSFQANRYKSFRVWVSQKAVVATIRNATATIPMHLRRPIMFLFKRVVLCLPVSSRGCLSGWPVSTHAQRLRCHETSGNFMHSDRFVKGYSAVQRTAIRRRKSQPLWLYLLNRSRIIEFAQRGIRCDLLRGGIFDCLAQDRQEVEVLKVATPQGLNQNGDFVLYSSFLEMRIISCPLTRQ